MSDTFNGGENEAHAERVLTALKTVVASLEANLSHATKHDLRQVERRLSEKLDKIMAFEQDEIDAINALSTLADTVSLKADKVQADVDAIVKLLQSNPGTPSQALVDAINKAKASTASLAAAGDKLDAAVTEADGVLPAPAPAGTP